MKSAIWRWVGTAVAVLFLRPGVSLGVAGGQLIYDNYLPIPAALAYTSTFSVRADGIDWASAQVVVTSVTQPSQTFTDGSVSVATWTVASFTALSSATAVGTAMKISSDTALVGDCVSGGGLGIGVFNVCNPANWAVDLVSSSQTACNIAAAIQATGVVLSTCAVGSASGVIYSTASYPGAVWNGFGINSSTITALSSSTFSGGQDNQFLTVNGVKLLANRDFYPLTSTTLTATNIATAITASSMTTGVAGTSAGTIVTASATVVGVVANGYAVFTSSQAALTLGVYTSSGPTTASGFMTGGTNAGYVINTSTIAVPGNNFGPAEGVYLSTGSNVTLAPLVLGTTYFVITNSALGSGNIELATTQGNALTGTAIVLTSSATKAVADTFTLNVPAIAGVPTAQWMASNDNTHWVSYTVTPFNVAIPSVTYGAYFSSGSVNNFDFGHYNYSYLGLAVVAPTAGAINVGAHVVGNAP